MPSANVRTLLRAYDRMLATYGPQDWWPGETPLEVIVGAVLTQNTNWRNVERAIANLHKAGMLDLAGLRAIAPDKLEELIRPAGYFRVKTRRLKNVIHFITETYGDVGKMFQTPLSQLRGELLQVNGVGPETADSILLYAGSFPTFVIDAYTARIVKRHAWIDLDADYHDMKSLFENRLDSSTELFNEYHALIVQVGKEHCGPKPKCDGCPLQSMLPKHGLVTYPVN